MLLNKLINTAYSFGAAIVVFGAWAKLEHKDFSDTALTAGLMVETGIFCLYGLLEWRREPTPGQPEQIERTCKREGGAGVEVGELTATMRQTNQILNKVFKAE